MLPVVQMCLCCHPRVMFAYPSLHVFSPCNAVQHWCIDSSHSITNSSPSAAGTQPVPISQRVQSCVMNIFPLQISSHLSPVLCWKGPVLLHTGATDVTFREHHSTCSSCTARILITLRNVLKKSLFFPYCGLCLVLGAVLVLSCWRLFCLGLWWFAES